LSYPRELPVHAGGNRDHVVRVEVDFLFAGAAPADTKSAGETHEGFDGEVMGM
jgi:hypothetical protein